MENIKEFKDIESDPVKNMQDTAVTNTMTDKTDPLPTITESEFNRKNIDALGNCIRVTDTDQDAGLELLCYVRCTRSDSNLVKRCRGVVFHGEDIVMNAFPYTVELNVNTDYEDITSTVNPIFDNCSFYDAYEGALIRVFHFDNRWYTSTHRKLNAFRSKWASRESFGTSFKKALEHEVNTNEKLRSTLETSDKSLLERFQNTLDKKKQYMFLICNSEANRIVCAAPANPTLYHVGTFIDTKLILDDDINIPWPKKHNFKNIDEVVNYVKNIDIRDLQGIICFTADNQQYKMIHPEYHELFKARGNEPSIKFRYLQVRMDPKLTSMLYFLYPKWDGTFDEIENIIYEIAKQIYTAYVQRFIKKRFVTVPTEEFKVIKECHKWHESDRANNRISLEKVIDILNSQSPTQLNRMIRRVKNEKIDRTQHKNEFTQRVRSNTMSSVNSPALKPSKSKLTIKSPLLLSKAGKNLTKLKI